MGLRQSLIFALALTGCPGADELTINTTALPRGKVGEAYQAAITAAGGAEEGYVWRATGGTPPPGLEIAAQGTPSVAVSGTPTSAGTFDFTVEVTDVDGNEASAAIRVVIDGAQLPGKLEITTASLANGAVGVAYDAMIAATGGSGPGYSWSLADGTLPPGLTLAESGTPASTISGTPTAAGSFSFTVRVADSAGMTAMKQLTLQIDPEPGPLSIVTMNLAPALLGTAYSAAITAEGGAGGYQWSISAGALPIGLALTGVGTPSTAIDGTPSESGSFDFTVRVEDSAGNNAEQQLRIAVAGGQLAIATLNLPNGVVGAAYSATVAAAGGSGAGFMWSVSQGTLPDGLTVSPGGTPETSISGTPTSTGSFTFDLTVTDDAGNSDSQSFTIEIARPVEIATTVLPGGREGGIYAADITATGGAGTGYAWSIVQGSLPPGLTLGATGSPSTTISGSPTEWGTYSFTVRVEEPLGSFDEQVLAIELSPIPIEIVTSTLPDGTALTPYAAVINTVNGSMMSYSWITTAGALPPGLTLDPAGTPPFTSIAGTPAMPGTYTVTITVTDGVTGDTDSQQLTIEIVAPPIAIDTDAIPAPVYGAPYNTTITSSGGSGTGFTWSVVQGTLPRGLRLDPNGTPSTTLTGFPIAEGPYDFTVQVQDSFGTTAAQQLSGTVQRTLTILTRALPIVDAGTNYSTSITAAGGSGAGYVWAITRGAPPAGLILGAAGTPSTTLAGISNALGLHTFEVRVTDSNGSSISVTLRTQVRVPQASTLLVGDLFVDGDTEVYVNTITPGSLSPIRISPAGAGLGDASIGLTQVQFSPDNSRAAFMGDFTTDGRISLYVVDLVPNPGNAVDVSGAIVLNGNVTSFVWAPDSDQLLFRADKNTDNVFELFWVDMRGGIIIPAQRISGAMVAGGGVTDGGYHFSPDAAKVVYNADQNVDTQNELFLVNVSGPIASAPIRINDDLVLNGDADESVLFADGNFLIYWAEEDVDTVFGLYRADITGGIVNARVRLNVRSAILDRAELSPDAGRLLFVSDDDITDSRELYFVDFTAPSLTAVKVNPAFPSNLYDVGSAKWSPDSRRILYAADQDNGTNVELYVARADTFDVGAPAKVNAPFTLATSNVESNPIDGYGWSPDGTRAAFLVDDAVDNVLLLWTADMTVNPPVASRVSPVLPPFGDVLDFLFSPDSDRIVYRADIAADAQEELFYSSLAGATPAPPQQVNPLLPLNGDVSGLTELRWSRNSLTIYYRADQVTDNVFEGFGVSVAGGSPGTPFMIHGILPTNADLQVLNLQQP